MPGVDVQLDHAEARVAPERRGVLDDRRGVAEQRRDRPVVEHEDPADVPAARCSRARRPRRSCADPSAPSTRRRAGITARVASGISGRDAASTAREDSVPDRDPARRGGPSSRSTSSTSRRSVKRPDATTSRARARRCCSGAPRLARDDVEHRVEVREVAAQLEVVLAGPQHAVVLALDEDLRRAGGARLEVARRDREQRQLAVAAGEARRLELRRTMASGSAAEVRLDAAPARSRRGR